MADAVHTSLEGAEESLNHRMQRPPCQGADLRLKQRGKKEPMIGDFDRLDSRIVTDGRHLQSVTHESIHKRRSQPETAPVEPLEGRAPAEPVHSRAGDSRHGPRLSDETAREPLDHECRGGWCGLGVFGCSDARDISGELHDRILKTPAGSEERLAGCSCPPDRRVTAAASSRYGVPVRARARRHRQSGSRRPYPSPPSAPLRHRGTARWQRRVPDESENSRRDRRRAPHPSSARPELDADADKHRARCALEDRLR